ncbi:hypothetical protein K438DRAFT_1780293 [Mycena galopus ATCC 62051]|nr:hypothetical protein K438DRAFT_1780293 [Mycena galopus ATCC 62051]
MASDLTLARRLFGRFRPHDDLNLRHLAALRKTLEVIGLEQVRETLRQTTGLRMVMGTGGTSSRVGTVFISRVVNGRRVTLEYSVARAVQDQLVAYLDGYDSTYRKNGRTYLLLHPRADYPWQPLQHAEQAWHDWVVPYLAQRGRVRPEWALQPLPEMQRNQRLPTPLTDSLKVMAAWSKSGRRHGSNCLSHAFHARKTDAAASRTYFSPASAHHPKLIGKKKGVPSNTMGSSASDEDSGVMHVSTEDVYSDTLRPSTPPPSRTPSPPPRKRQRRDPSQIPKRVLRLLDIEAHEDDPTEEDEEEDVDGPANFIDDEPNHQYSDFSSQPLFLPRGETETLDAELLAARYEQRARDEREEERARAVERAEAQRDAVSDFPPLPTLPLQGFCIAPYWEPRLVDFMTTVKGVALVGTQGPGSRLVFYETRDTSAEDAERETRGIPRAAEVATEVKEWLRKRRVWFRGPEEIPLAECRALLGFPQVSAGRADTRYNCFGRLKSIIFDRLYLNDLVFVGPAWEQGIWVVPRVHIDGSPLPLGQRPPRRLWDGNALREHIPLKKLHFERRGTRCTWGDRLFATDCGLEILPMSLNHTVAGVHPTDDELELFLASKCQDIIASFKGVTCALHEGDRVVVQDNHEQIDNAGEIIAFFERREAHQSLRMAVCLPPLVVGRDPRIATFDADLGMMRTEMVADVEVPKRAEVYPVSTLRLHVLSPRHRVNVGDRVVVVAGSLYRGYSGRISEFINEETIRFDATEPEASARLEMPLRHVRRDFRLGDIVRAVRGEYQSQIGLVITLYLGGEIEVYICDNAMDNYVDSKTGELKVTNDEWRGQDVDAMEVKVYHPDPIGRTRQETGAAWDRGETQQQKGAAWDCARADWERDIMNTGRFVTGMFVRIQKGPKKAHFGVVTGYRYTKAATAESLVQRRTSTHKELAEDIRLQVVTEHSQVTLDLSIDHVVERFSGLPLLVAVLLQRYRKLYVYEGRPERPPTPPPPTIETADLTQAEVNIVIPVATSSAPDIGETSGLWLTHKNLARKRIDVQVVSAESLVVLRNKPNVGNKVGVKVMKVAGYTGYLRPFDRAVADAKAVIVIGPDVEGDRSRIGEYAETIPELSSTTIVRVRFAWEPRGDGSDYQAHVQYQLQYQTAMKEASETQYVETTAATLEVDVHTVQEDASLPFPEGVPTSTLVNDTTAEHIGVNMRHLGGEHLTLDGNFKLKRSSKRDNESDKTLTDGDMYCPTQSDFEEFTEPFVVTEQNKQVPTS